MKKRKLIRRVILWALLLAGAAALTVFVFIPLFDTSGEGDGEPVTVFNYEEGEKLYTLESDVLKLELDPATTHFTLTDKRTGYEWLSTPADAASDPVALPVEKHKLQSNLTLTYATSTGMKTLFSSNEYSVQNGVYQVTMEGDAIRVDYSLGKISPTYRIPPAMGEERFLSFVDQMDKKTQKAVKEYYSKKNINKLRKTDNKDELLAKYPDLANEILYILREDTKTHLKAKIEEYFEAVGYTEEDYQYDMSRCNLGQAATAVFNASLRYRLEGGDLVVELPLGELGYYANYPITNITLLPAFGAGGTQDTGFLLVPDGAGAQIAFNNGKTSQDPYYANLYGWDWASIRTQVASETRINFPVFGIARNGASFLCMLEDGASWAGISADISGRYTSYNTVNAGYTIIHGDAYDVSERTNNSVYMFEAEPADAVIRQRYRFLTTDDTTQMANAYGEYLTERYPEMAAKEVQSTTVVDIVGAVDKVQQRFGVPTNLPVPLTTYQQAAELLTTLNEAGFTNLSVRLSGWMNGGLNQRILNKVKLIDELGKASDLKAFSARVTELGGELYLDGLMQFARDSGVWQGFIPFRHAAKFTTREEAEIPEYSSLWYGDPSWRDHFYLMRPSLVQTAMDLLSKAASDYGAQGVSFRDIGGILSADYDPKALVTREQALRQQQEKLKAIAESGQRVMVRQGNDYALPYTDVITDMDLDGGGYGIIDAYIPFYPTAIRGKAAYTGAAVNLSPDREELLLRSAEMGADLCFAFFHESASAIQETWYSEYFGASVEYALDEMAQINAEYAAAMAPTRNQPITGHSREGSVTRTTFGGGARVYVNYGYEDAAMDGVRVPARSYVVKGGAQ